METYQPARILNLSTAYVNTTATKIFVYTFVSSLLSCLNEKPPILLSCILSWMFEWQDKVSVSNNSTLPIYSVGRLFNLKWVKPYHKIIKVQSCTYLGTLFQHNNSLLQHHLQHNLHHYVAVQGSYMISFSIWLSFRTWHHRKTTTSMTSNYRRLQ